MTNIESTINDRADIKISSEKPKTKELVITSLLHRLGEYAVETVGSKNSSTITDAGGSMATEIVPTDLN